MDLVQSRMVTSDVERLAAFYAAVLEFDAVLNDYYVEVPAGGQSVAFSRVRFAGVRDASCGPLQGIPAGSTILDFATDDVDGDCVRLDRLGVDWVSKPAMQPWGRVAMMFRDPEGHLVNVFSRREGSAS